MTRMTSLVLGTAFVCLMSVTAVGAQETDSPSVDSNQAIKDVIVITGTRTPHS